MREHKDPGLFSLNVFSECDSRFSSMYFYNNEKKKWTDMPKNTGVIFCGSYSEQFGVPGALHRVNNRHKDRFSI